MKTILFVCTGNICRSPMAEGLFRRMAKGRGDYKVMSAGLGAINGQAPSTYAVRGLKEIGIDITGLRSRMVTAQMVLEADLIFGMTHGHVDAINLLYPQAQEKTFLLREFDDTLQVYEKDISDPIGGSYDVYLNCRDQIEQGIVSIFKFIEQDSMNTAATAVSGKVFTLALGSDHAGLRLKETIKDHLARRGFRLQDFGATSTDSTDYPDYAQAVAQNVSGGRSDLGILCCATGVGMSIAANKVPGTRAALAFDERMATLARQHNNANVLCLGEKVVSAETALKIVDSFLEAHFEGGRHERRVGKLEKGSGTPLARVRAVDADVAEVISLERQRQEENIELIASENFTSAAVMEAQGSCLTNKYAEGYPGKRWYGGCENVDTTEQLAIDRACKLFGAKFANVQPHSGSQANAAVYFSVLQPGDKVLGMNLAHGGHLTHGHPANFSGRFYKFCQYGVSQKDERIDYDELAEVAKREQPKMITAGASAYPRIIDFQRMSEIAKSVGAYLFVDMAHIAGLVAAGVHPNPVPVADFVTTTTHKSLRGPRGGMILTNSEELFKKIQSQVFPGIQGGPLEHVIAAKAVCFHEALQPSFKQYAAQVVSNAKALAARLAHHGYRITSGGTDNHLMLVDLRPKGLNGAVASAILDEAGITVNKNGIPFDTEPITKGGGIRVGTPAVTTRGMKEEEMMDIADFIHRTLTSREDAAAIAKIREEVHAFSRKFPLPF